VQPVGSYCKDISRYAVNKTLKIKRVNVKKISLKVSFLWTDLLY